MSFRWSFRCATKSKIVEYLINRELWSDIWKKSEGRELQRSSTVVVKIQQVFSIGNFLQLHTRNRIEWVYYMYTEEIYIYSHILHILQITFQVPPSKSVSTTPPPASSSAVALRPWQEEEEAGRRTTKSVRRQSTPSPHRRQLCRRPQSYSEMATEIAMGGVAVARTTSFIRRGGRLCCRCVRHPLMSHFQH